MKPFQRRNGCEVACPNCRCHTLDFWLIDELAHVHEEAHRIRPLALSCSVPAAGHPMPMMPSRPAITVMVPARTVIVSDGVNVVAIGSLMMHSGGRRLSHDVFLHLRRCGCGQQRKRQSGTTDQPCLFHHPSPDAEVALSSETIANLSCSPRAPCFAC